MSTGGAADALNSPADADAFSDAVEDAVPDLDFLLIDAGPGPGTARVALAPAAPEFMVVLGGQPRSLKEGYALVKLMNRVYARRQFQVVLARAGEADAATQLGNFVHTCKRHLGIEPVRLGQIPFDPQIENCGRLGRPVAGTFPETPAAAIFRAMAEVLDNGLYACLDPSRGHPLVRLLAQSSRLQSNPLWAAVQ
jgi:MinD-like ATPase involved in chromosome partitioning or flagellar assembly